MNKSVSNEITGWLIDRTYHPQHCCVHHSTSSERASLGWHPVAAVVTADEEEEEAAAASYIGE